jgi:hypothetical protein
MPDIHQLESIPIGNDASPQNLTPDNPSGSWVLHPNTCDGHEAYDYDWLEHKAQDGVGAM